MPGLSATKSSFEKLQPAKHLSNCVSTFVRSQRRAVVRFTAAGKYMSAINVCDAGSAEGDWYTSITDEAEQAVPFGDYTSGSSRFGRQVQMATGWRRAYAMHVSELVAATTCSDVLDVAAGSRDAAGVRCGVRSAAEVAVSFAVVPEEAV